MEALQLTREQLPQARVALQRLTDREASLVAALHQATAEVEKVEECKCWPQAWPGLRTPEAQVRRNSATVPGPAALHAGGPHLL